MTRVYIAGPMTGVPAANYPAFHAKAARLRGMGYEVLSPAELYPDPDAAPEWRVCVRAAIRLLLVADAVYLLDDWLKSKGAVIEHNLAVGLGLPLYGPPWYPEMEGARA